MLEFGDLMPLQSIRLTNFRSFLDTGRIALRPLVILVGANNTGKSSLLRFFPLLRQTMSARTSGPLLWYGEDVDFGDFDQALCRAAKERVIGVELEIEGRVAGPLGLGRGGRWGIPYALTSRSQIVDGEGGPHVAKLEIQSEQDRATLRFAADGGLEDLAYGGESLLRMQPHDEGVSGDEAYLAARAKERLFIPADLSLVRMGNSLIPGFDKGGAFESWMDDWLQGELRRVSDCWFSRESNAYARDAFEAAVMGATWMPPYGSNADVLEGLEEYIEHAVEFRDSNAAALEEIARRIRKTQFVRRLPVLCTAASRSLLELASAMNYLGPMRQTPERFYRIQQLAVDRITPQGENLAMFLHSLPEADRNELAAWIDEHFGFRVQVGIDGSHVVLMIEEHGRRYNLVDTGYGFSQVLPVAVQCWAAAKGRTMDARTPPPSLVAIEQPELHLHPWYQARLADMFAGLVNARDELGTWGPRVMVETHSEALLERLGQLVEQGRLRREDALVLFVERDPDTGVSTVRQSEFDEKGVLGDWPIGFFAA